MIYGYARISTKTQKIERQIKNLQTYYQDIVIHQEAYTGTSITRPEWTKLQRKLKVGDTLVFDSVSRMSRDAKEGSKKYFQLREKGINLVFLKERHIDTESYDRALEESATSIGDLGEGAASDLVKDILKALEKFQVAKATDDIKRAFEQSQKEVDDLKQRTREGLREAKARGSQVGRIEGKKVQTQKEKDMLPKIQKMARKFEGNMKDSEVLEILKIDRKTYYKYCKLIKASV